MSDPRNWDWTSGKRIEASDILPKKKTKTASDTQSCETQLAELVGSTGAKWLINELAIPQDADIRIIEPNRTFWNVVVDNFYNTHRVELNRYVFIENGAVISYGIAYYPFKRVLIISKVVPKT
jgi:hypothetical protein